MRYAHVLLLSFIGSVLSGCASPPFASMPAPVRSYEIRVARGEGADEEIGTGYAQAVVHGARALTVAHGFQGSLWGLRSPAISIRGGLARVAVAGRGAYPDAEPDQGPVAITQDRLDSIVHDWLAFEAQEPLDTGAPVRWRVSTTEPAFGELLHAVRDAGGGRFERVPFRRQNGAFVDMRTPDGLYLAVRRGGIDMRGWSGCFVGRRVGDQWEFVGVLVGSFDGDGDHRNGREVACIIRPPEAAIRWLLGEDVALPGAPPPDDP